MIINFVMSNNQHLKKFLYFSFHSMSIEWFFLLIENGSKENIKEGSYFKLKSFCQNLKLRVNS